MANIFAIHQSMEDYFQLGIELACNYFFLNLMSNLPSLLILAYYSCIPIPGDEYHVAILHFTVACEDPLIIQPVYYSTPSLQDNHPL